MNCGEEMYTTSIESEKKFLSSLYRSRDFRMNNGDCVLVCSCPKCKNGSVLTISTQIGKSVIQYNSFCDSCNEQFVLPRISSDIFFHTPFRMINTLKTPFGDIRVKINGKPVSFRCREEVIDGMTLKIVDIVFSSLHMGDIVSCGFDSDILDFFGSDERNVTYSCRNDKTALCLCAYDPEEYISEEKLHCFEIDHMDGKEVVYHILREPSNFDENYFYQSKIASVGVAWQAATENDEAEEKLDFALFRVIG